MKRVIVSLLALAALFSCSRKVTVIIPVNPDEVKFTASVETYTTKATDSAFEDGDKVSIAAGNPINETTVGTISGTEISIEEPIYWTKDQTASTTFVAVYQAGGVAEPSANLSYDLLKGGRHDYAAHNLFMVAARTAAPRTQVNLKFKHPFAKVGFVIHNQLDEAISKVEIKGVVMDARLDIKEEKVVLGTTTKTFEPVKLADDSYAAVIMPQTATMSVVVTAASGTTYTFEQQAGFVYAPGTAYSTEITVDKKSSGPVAFEFTVVPWSSGGSLDYELDKDISHE
ncbi:MAG: fimbrillin family protein [Bacteroidales bacterium]|nr:fimbrillin family protein [Bacteroidales bacterium]